MKSVQNWYKYWLKISVVAILMAVILLNNSIGGTEAIAAPRQSTLAQGDAITDPQAILRYALPIDNDTIRKLQSSIEDIANQLRGKRWRRINKDIKDAAFVLKVREEKLLANIPEERREEAEAIANQLKSGVEELQEIVKTRDKAAISQQRQKLLEEITQLEGLMVQGFPFTVPSEYDNLPQLLGRATVEMETTKGPLTIVVDGYSAPVNGGNFVDLVQRGFYDGLDFVRAEDFYVLQAGDPPGEEEGFIDPNTGEYRAIPLEVLVKGDSEPVYGYTLEELGRYLDPPALPFNAYGAVALARPADNPNGGSSQFFFFKFDNELTPPGYNLMDGRYSVFGYLVDGKDVLEKLTAEDKIISAKVVDGSENLVQPQSS